MRQKTSAILLSLTALIGACAPALPRVDTSQSLPARWAGPASTAGSLIDSEWWASFHDPSLQALQHTALKNSPTLGSAAAAVLAARAQARETLGNLLPSLSANESGSVSHGTSLLQPGTVRSATSSIDASWEIDLFGRYHASARAAHARARASEADYANANLSLLAEVADDYVQYRACRLLQAAYAANLTSEEGTVQAAEALARSGLSSDSELGLARANLSSARINLASQKASCDALTQVLALVVGAPQQEVLPILGQRSALPRPTQLSIRSVPADLLRQRPDVVSAEYALLGKLEDARAAKASLYPGLSLSGSLSLTAGVESWSFGPTLSLPIFNGGELKAASDVAVAGAMSAAQSYRSTVLTAVSDVETALIKLDAARRKRSDASTAVAQYQSYFQAIDANWRAGGDTLLNRESAVRQVLTAEITEISNRQDELRELIALYKATGGGWSLAAPATTPNAASAAPAKP